MVACVIVTGHFVLDVVVTSVFIVVPLSRTADESSVQDLLVEIKGIVISEFYGTVWIQGIAFFMHI